jgi:DNA-binding transcriptional ArsR family regulator
VFASLAPLVTWAPPVLLVHDYPVDRDLVLGGRGLRLIPSYFCFGAPVALADPDLDPVLVYPALPGQARILDRTVTPTADGARPGAAALLGPTRLAVLQATSVSLTTTELARIIGISPATASYHTAVLRSAGLIASHRSANMMLHLATPLARMMLGQEAEGPLRR